MARTIWTPIETGGGSIVLRSNGYSNGEYGEIEIRETLTPTVAHSRRLQLTHAAALELHFRLGALLGAGQL